MDRYTLRLFDISAGFTSHASWPVWAGSTSKEVYYRPMPKKQAVKLWHRARDFDRQTRQAGRQGGAIGHTALQVLHTLIFDFLNFSSGRLDPSHEAIARRSNLSVRAVRSALKRLRTLGIVAWLRRCSERRVLDRFVLAQDTNAYTVLESSQWRGYVDPAIASLPPPSAWGACPPLPSVIDQAVAERKKGGGFSDMIAVLGSDLHDDLAQALARLGQALAKRTS